MDSHYLLLPPLEGKAKEQPNIAAIKKIFERGDTPEVIKTLKLVITLTEHGESLPGLLMHVIRYVMPKEDKAVKKLLLLYWEVCEKYDPDTKTLLPEFLLACNSIRNDLNHPNEYIRGCTLRWLTKFTEVDILDPLVPSVVQNLEHYKSYVRRNAILAVSAIHKANKDLIPNAIDLAEKFLAVESDMSAKRNAFLMLYERCPERAVAYLSSTIDQVQNFGDILQLVVLDLIRKMCRNNPHEKSRYLRCILGLLNSSSDSVVYQCAQTLVALSSSPVAVKAATQCLIKLLCNQSSTAVKLIVLERLQELKRNHASVLQEMAMDILSVLSSDMEIRTKALAIVLDLASPRNVVDIVGVLKKELLKPPELEFEHGSLYKQKLIHALHVCTVRYPDVAGAVMPTVMDHLEDANAKTSLDVVLFVRELAETHSALRSTLLVRLLESLPRLNHSESYCSALWILGEFSTTPAAIDQAFGTLMPILSPLPFQQEDPISSSTNTSSAPPPASTAPRPPLLNADGTYATQVAPPMPDPSAAAESQKPVGLRAMIVNCEFVVANSLANCVLKLALRARALESPTAERVYHSAHQLLSALSQYCSSTVPPLAVAGQTYQALVPSASSSSPSSTTGAASAATSPPVTSTSHHSASSSSSSTPSSSSSRVGVSCAPAALQSAFALDYDSRDRILMCLRLLERQNAAHTGVVLEKCHESFVHSLSLHKATNPDSTQSQEEVVQIEGFRQVDDVITIRQLKCASTHGTGANDEQEIADAVGGGPKTDSDFATRLGCVKQLTGFSDPIYAEACVTVHHFDILLDILLVNRTTQVLQNVCVELSTLGELKVCDRPVSHTLAPGESKQLRIRIKVSSSDPGVVFGSIVYDTASSSSDRNCVVLHDLRINVMDYVSDSVVTDAQYRTMWSEFEWENKVAVNTHFSSCVAFLQHIIKTTHMRCLNPNPVPDDDGDCPFLAANLYAKSYFGEDALVNVCVEHHNGKLEGAIRIRTPTQGVALSLGEKISLAQRGSCVTSSSSSSSSSSSAPSSPLLIPSAVPASSV
eukprot:gnl/Spiro4/20875_TR10168_c0_g1_i1.p1 gnl/Spiro4/20875_TR10168_c0_g1~~gnl/Spiro4/20875_TR10168_c0_g1_i1.p1  ORF type:complete len:1061 (+),score=260.88 gnl/Spiro4/20875_TR10168_c0_g1_i1:50-3184(+)